MANRDIIVKLRLAGEEFDRDFKIKFQDLTDAAEKSSAQAGTRAGSSFGKGFAAAAGAAGAAMGLAINKAANLGAEIASTSRQFNIGVENLQIWRQAAANAGVSAGNLGSGLAALTQKIGEANSGNKQAQQGFVGLGVSFKTAAGDARATDAVMLDLAKRIAEIKDPSERVRVGTQLLGDEFKTLYPLLLDGAQGFNQAAKDLDGFGAMLSQREIQELEKTNAKIEQMKTALSISVAKIVAENADAIIGLANSIATLTGSMAKYATEYPRFAGALAGAAAGYRAAGPIGAAAGTLGGLYVGQEIARDQADANMDVKFRVAQLKTAQQRVQATNRGTVDRSNDPVAKRAQAELNRQTELFHQASKLANAAKRQSTLAETLLAPKLTADGSSRRTGGGGARPRSATQSAAEREAERAAKEAIRNEENLRDAIARTLRAQEDSAEVARIRADQGEEAAARAEAELAFLRQHPLAVNDTVEALANALGITKELTKADRDRLQLLIDQGNAAQSATGDAAAAKAREAQEREAAKQEERNAEIARREAERWAAEYERAILDVADIYETAFRGGTKDLWRAFKDEGTRMIAEIAAQWTLAMIAGQPFNLNAAAGAAFGRSPLSSIFFGAGGRFGAANDNGLLGGATTTGFGGGVFPLGGGRTGNWRQASGKGWGMGGAGLTLAQNKASFLQAPEFALGLGTLAGSLVGGSSTLGQIGGLAGSIGGQALGASIGAIGGPIGAVVGAVAGKLLGGLLSGTPRGAANLTGAGQFTLSGNNKGGAQDTAGTLAGQVSDTLRNIADQLGGNVGRFAVSIGVSGDSYHVDPTGQGRLKKSQGGRDFNQDSAAAIAFAVADAIKDGAITGISQASQNLLRKGGDFEKQIEKALLIEQIPKLLRQRFDPLGVALDDLYDKFRKVNDALREGSASADQIAQARQLWELEKADAIASIGAASQQLKDFLASLNVGAGSPLSLREQREEAERQLSPFIAQITAAENARAEVQRLRSSGGSAAEIAAAEERARAAASAINQQGFTEASQLLLSISRQANASSGAFFSDFDRIRALTGQAIGFVDQAAARPQDTRDPFSQAIAANTADAAAILSEHTRLLQAMNDNIAALNGGRLPIDFIRAPRAFTGF